MGILQSDKFSPFVFIGLGGSGASVVNAIAKKLQRHPNWSRIQNLCHFVAIDTNKHDLNNQKMIPEAGRFLISSFDRVSYIDRKRGKFELPEDPMVTQWAHPDYKFREGATPGAGQIRVESRLSLYYNLEDDRGGIISGLKSMLDQASAPGNPYRDDQDRCVNVMIFSSVAGGTGSGAFVTMAYLLQDLIQEHGWGRPKIVANLMLPAVFIDKVEQVLHEDINANSYAALKELEHLTRIGYPGRIESVQFHYNPLKKRPTHVTRRPFALVYLIDKPAELSISRYTEAVADSAFLQVFSPFLGQQEGEYDNYDKHQKVLARGHFTVHYGSYGSAVLTLPRRDILNYAGMRYVARAFDKYLNFGDDPEFAIDWDDERFGRLQEDEQNKIIDDKFVGWLKYKADQEEAEELKGIFSAIWSQQSGEVTLRELFARRMREIFDGIESLVDLVSFDRYQISEESTSLQRSLNELRKDVRSSGDRVLSEYLPSVLAEIKSGRLFESFFKGSGDVDPLSQRLFLIQLLREEILDDADGTPHHRFGPFEEAADNHSLFIDKENPSNLDGETVQRALKDLEADLAGAADRGLLSFGENKRFAAVKRNVQDFFDNIEMDNRIWFGSAVWQKVHAALVEAAAAQLVAFRNVARIAAEATDTLNRRAERFQRDPGAVDESAQSAEYYLDLEVLRDDRGEQRLWGRFFEHRLDRRENFDDPKIFALITQAFRPVQDDGRLRGRDAREIVAVIREALSEEAESTFARAMSDMPDMDLPGALALEARYVLAGEAADDEALGAVSDDAVERYMADKMQRARNHCVILANIDPSKYDPDVRVNNCFFVGMARSYRGEDRMSLGNITRRVDGDVKFVDGWEDPDTVVFYRATLGMPLYYYSRVAGELYSDYCRVKANPSRNYPLHIDSNFEDLPNLDPIELQQAEEKRLAEEAARKVLDARNTLIWSFTASSMIGNVSQGADGLSLAMNDMSKPLAAKRWSAFVAYAELPEMMRADLGEAVGKTMERGLAGRKEREKLIEDLESHGRRLKQSYSDAFADDDEREQKFLEEERAVVESRIEALKG
jgi:hypothetical protein